MVNTASVPCGVHFIAPIQVQIATGRFGFALEGLRADLRHVRGA